MKFPKLKHTFVCQFLLYLPGFAFFLGLFALCCIPGEWREHPAIFIPLLLLSAVLSLVYLICCAGLLLTSDVLFFRIRQWKKDREEYNIVPDEDDPKRLTLLPEPVWYYRKDRGFLFSLLLHGKLNRRKVRKNELEKLEARVAARLNEQGYTVTKEE